MRAGAVVLAVVVATVTISTENQLAAQSAPLEFDVVSIKENKTASQDGGISGPTPSRFTITNLSVASMIRYAYGIRNYQLIDLPGWASTTPYDVVATYPEGTVAPSIEQARGMLQSLLVNRYGLQAHRETRQLPAYELTLARKDGRLGSQLVASTLDCDQAPTSTGRGGLPACSGFQTRSLISGRGRPLDVLATALQAMVRQKVLNRTGLAGTYDWTVRWEGGRGPAEEATVEEIATMITALDDQLGLKLASTRAPEDVVVVDAIRRPTEN